MSANVRLTLAAPNAVASLWWIPWWSIPVGITSSMATSPVRNRLVIHQPSLVADCWCYPGGLLDECEGFSSHWTEDNPIISISSWTFSAFHRCFNHRGWCKKANEVVAWPSRFSWEDTVVDCCWFFQWRRLTLTKQTFLWNGYYWWWTMYMSMFKVPNKQTCAEFIFMHRTMPEEAEHHLKVDTFLEVWEGIISTWHVNGDINMILVMILWGVWKSSRTSWADFSCARTGSKVKTEDIFGGAL